MHPDNRLIAVNLLLLLGIAMFAATNESETTSREAERVLVVPGAAVESAPQRINQAVEAKSSPIAVSVQAPDDYDPLVDGVLAEQSSEAPAAALYKQLRSERPDKDWSPRAQRLLEKVIGGIPFVDHGFPSKVTCGATLCEVIAHVSGDATVDNANIAIKAIQQLNLAGDEGKALFETSFTNVSFGPSKSYPKGDTFVRYFKRGTPTS